MSAVINAGKQRERVGNAPAPSAFRRPSGGLEYVVLVLFAVGSFAWFTADAVHAATHHMLFIGADGWYPMDQGQYLAWATDAAHHGLIANLYTISPGSHVFLQPLWLATGLLHTGLGLSYAVLVGTWKAVTVIVLFFAVRKYARSILGVEGWKLALALLLALFMLSPSYLVDNLLELGLHGSTLANIQIGTETDGVLLLAGSFPTALAVAATIVFLLEIDKLLAGGPDGTGGASRRHGACAAAAGCAASWLHPWQGMVLIAITFGLIIWERPSWRRHAQLIAPLALTAAPLLDYQALPHLDGAWALSQSITSGPLYNPSIRSLSLVLLPLVAFMLPGWIVRPVSARERMLRLWPVAIAVVYVAAPSDNFHALGGFSIPTALLGVIGWSRLRCRSGKSRRWVTLLAAVAVASAVIGTPIAVGRTLRDRYAASLSYELPRDDARALGVLAKLPRGKVLTNAVIGNYVPVITDDSTWVGHPSWTPDYGPRALDTADLFDSSSRTPPRDIGTFVRSTGATYVLQPCGSTARLGNVLSRNGFSWRRVGCANLFRRT